MWGESKMTPSRPLDLVEKDGKIVNVMVKSLEKYGVDLPSFNEEIAIRAINVLKCQIFNNSCTPAPWQYKVVSMETAILGIPGNRYAKAITRMTSAGYPHVKTSRSKGKTKFLGCGDEYDLNNPHMLKLAKEILVTIRKLEETDYEPTYVFIDCPKDEKLPFEKVFHEKKIRMVSICPFELGITWRQYFFGFQVFLTENSILNSMAIGINPYSDDWDIIYKILKARGSKYTFAGDFSGFDSKISSRLMWLIWVFLVKVWYETNFEKEITMKKMEDKFYDDISSRAQFQKDQIVRGKLWKAMCNSKHVFFSWFYDWINDVPSGHPFTIYIDCLVNLTYHIYAWEERKTGELNFFDWVSIFVLGDDVLGSVDPKCVDWYNPETLFEVMSTFGQTYTSLRKDGTSVGWEVLECQNFLKRTFRFSKFAGRMVAPLSMNSILEMPYWTKRCSFKESITRQNVETALMELSLHGYEIWKKYSMQIITASILKLDFTPYFTDYHVTRQKALSYVPPF